MEPLKLKQIYGRGLGRRVTRAFPEVFATWLKNVPPHIKLDLRGELASFMSPEVTGRVTLDVTETQIDWFDLRVVLDIADTTLSAEEIKLLLAARGRYVRLKGKGWRRLQYDLSEDENERLARLGLNARELTAEPQRLHALQLADEAARRFLPPQQVEQIQRRAGEIKARVAPDLPATVTAALRPYQLEGFHFLAYLHTNHFGGILADDMGLGKTLQALAWLVWLREQRLGAAPAADLPTLVVCPKSVMDNWHAEAARFTPGLKVRVWRANELSDFKEKLGSADLHVLNYNQLRSAGERLISAHWLAVILDEGQYIKNPTSQTAQVARALRCEHRLVLSGTPIENRLLDLWSLMAFAMPGILGNRAQFARLFDAKNDPFARRRLASRVRPFVLRRTKAQVAKDLPDRSEEDLFCEIEGEQKTLYRAELKRAQQLLLGIQTQKELAQHQFNFLTSLLRLRQICCHPRLLKEDSKAPSAKTEALLEQLEPLMDEGQKVLVFSQFVEMLDLLHPELQQRSWPVFYLAGSTENRGELVKKFQEAEGAAVFLISLKAGGFGLNLTAASYVILFDPWWNPAVENQAIDRTHRIGQTKNVMAYRLLIKDSIEEKIRELQKHKKALAEDVLGEEKFAQSLTLDDLRFLFAD
jgi:SNF2 family DNA or RNA helicase